jgi:hypothetical protein
MNRAFTCRDAAAPITITAPVAAQARSRHIGTDARAAMLNMNV